MLNTFPIWSEFCDPGNCLGHMLEK